MATPALQYEHSLHYLNVAGVRAQCVDCHVPKPFFQRVVHMMFALRDVWGHVTGVIDTPEKFRAHKLAMQQYVWTEMTNDDYRLPFLPFLRGHGFRQPAGGGVHGHALRDCGRNNLHLVSPWRRARSLSTLADAASSSAPGAAAAMDDVAKLYTSRCGQCHAAPALRSYTAAQWPGLVTWMQAPASLTDGQSAEIVTYLQAEATTAASSPANSNSNASPKQQ